MKVRDIVARKAVPVLTVNMNLDVGAAAGLLARHRVGALPAVEAGGTESAARAFAIGGFESPVQPETPTL